jgi:uncharacterized protein YbjT (DUF2867 family)
MIIIMGASGQVGSAVATQLQSQGKPVKGVIRNPEKANALKQKGIEVAIADAFDEKALQIAFEGGEAVLLLTPDMEKSNDLIGDTKNILRNYRHAVLKAGIRKIVGISSMGAHLKGEIGNLKMSHLLEHTFADSELQQIFVRPAYYYSNWLDMIDSVKESGVLPTFFSPEQKIPMVSPMDIAALLAEKLVEPVDKNPIYEAEGPEWYSSADIAKTYGEVLGKKVTPEQIPQEKWQDTMKEFGLSDDAVKNFMQMTYTIVDGKANPEGEGTEPVILPTSFKQFLIENS